ncbi:hypothetical protein P0082_00435 [Candidatus Haliotispira prima]|uniref:PD-(D/E)XK nuclease superfamily protein n=1 Tax=Candidatus Haliotispira prima TaxID=3034016 RepID=A0ABY8MJH1_9SPIO|nr:hypothetical protein P0082_00435 [Candidatus Haliotispira prima]
MEPNLFRIATRGLAQDAFFTWLLQWADDTHKKRDQEISKVAKSFVRLLIGKGKSTSVRQVEVRKQWQHIDMCVEVDNKYFIVIDDKMNTGGPSEEPEDVGLKAKDYAEEKGLELVSIYLQTGNESQTRNTQIEEKGHTIVNRKAIIELLSSYTGDNEIFREFKDYLDEIEHQTNQFSASGKITSDKRIAEGFFLELQNHMKEWYDWKYVSNRSGGYLGFWYFWKTLAYLGKQLYIQIDNNYLTGKVELTIRINNTNWNKKVPTTVLQQIFTEIRPLGERHGLTLRKPLQFRAGNTALLLMIDDVFHIDKDGRLDFDRFMDSLKRLENLIDAYCESRRVRSYPMRRPVE